MPQVPFAFEFESERPNDNSVTKHLSRLPFVKFRKVGQMAELATVLSALSLNWHSAVQTQMQTEPEEFRNALFVIWFIVNIVMFIDHALI